MKLHFFSDYSIIIRSMKKVKAILSTFLHSLVPQDIYYPKLLHTRFKFSVKYYIFLIVVLSFIFTTIVIYQYSPNKIINYKNAVTRSLLSFPDDAVIRIIDGTLEVNQNKPLFLWLYRDEKPFFVFMAHTKDELSLSNNPLPVMFLGKNSVQFAFKGSAFTQAYDKTAHYLISKETLRSFVNMSNSFFPPLLFFFFVFLVLVLPLSFGFWSTVSILVNASIVFLLLKSFIPHIHLKKCIQAGMHGTHIPLITTILLYALFPASPNVIIITSSLMFVFTLVAVYEMYSGSLPQAKKR
jgi:hypothetical protein